MGVIELALANLLQSRGFNRKTGKPFAAGFATYYKPRNGWYDVLVPSLKNQNQNSVMTKLKFKATFTLLLASLVLTTLQAEELPNVIFVMADDLGIGDVSPTNPDCKIKTPNLQVMANEGITFLDAHSPSAVCTPTRYSVLTGRYNWRSRLARGVLGGSSSHLIPGDRPTVAHMLHQSGYHNQMIGKWHLGWDWAKVAGTNGKKIDFTQPVKNGPDINGFDGYYGHCGSLDMAPYVWVDTGRITAIPDREEGVTRKEDRYGWYRKGPIGPDFEIDEVLPHLFGKSITYVKDRAAAKDGKPFFLYLPLPAPHTPIVPKEPFKNASEINPYADFVMQVDHHMGQLMAAVKEAGIDDNTIIFFTSDNGCSPEANFELLKEHNHDPSAGYRGHKADIYEGGHRIPLIVRWPTKIKAGQTTNELACLTDLYATLRDVTGQPAKDLGGEDSFSLLPVFKGEKTARTSLISHSIGGYFSIRQGDWKLCLSAGSGGWSSPSEKVAKTKGLPKVQLFNLQSDRGERENLLEDNPEQVQSLLKLLTEEVANGRCTPGNPVPNDREVTFLPEGYSANADGADPSADQTVTVSHSALQGIGAEAGVMRRDPSDVIKVGDLFYVWYSKGTISPGYDATVWYATSTDGRKWTEKGQALAKGKPGTWEGASVFTPNIMVAEGRYWLFYTGTSNDFHKKPFSPDSKIGIAVSDSPNGPWERLATNPALSNSDNKEDFDSHLVDDACLLIRDGKYYFYYKGRKLGLGPGKTKMGLAIADHPQGPYVRHTANPVIEGNHEVLVWPQGKGVTAMIGTTGPKEITKSIMYAADGVNFSKIGDVVKGPVAGGAYRPEAFTDSGKGDLPEWGVEIRGSNVKEGKRLPCIGRFDVSTDSDRKSQSFADDLSFMSKHTDIVLLKDDGAAVAVAPAYQGRVMTSTFDQKSGPSFGWINRPVIEKGLLSEEARKGKLEEHIYIFGGEERFWLGPEGGQYAIFFKPGTEFTFEDWTTPAAIDTDAYKLMKQTESSATFAHDTELVNHSGTQFKVGIQRTVTLLDKSKSATALGVTIGDSIQMVAYETDNRITNTGSEAWKPETGLMSIWILGMYNPSPKTTVVIPFKDGDEATLGPKVNDTYFGKVPLDYLKVKEKELFFRGDGTRRGKIGINARRSKGIAGSYDAAGRVLNIVTYNVQEAPNGFVNSMWELQEKPYSGDVINSYNDGSPEKGKPPLGPFYELETSSPAAALKPGETMKHVQRTFHLHGSEAELDVLAKQLLGLTLDSIKSAF